MRSKISGFREALTSSDFDVVVVTESWLVSSIGDAELTPDGWLCFRRDRHSQRDVTSFGGGVLIMARAFLSPSQLVIDDGGVEQLWVKISTPGQTFAIGGAYIPPRSPLEPYVKLVETCTAITAQLRDGDDALLFCDLNLPRLNWIPHDDFP